MKRVTAICTTGEGAQRALDALIEAHFSSEDITILRMEGRRLEELPVGQRTGIRITLPIGIAIGATLGAALFLSGALPGIGVATEGALLGALEGIALGGAAGWLLRLLAGLGWWKVDADFPTDDRIRSQLLVGVTVPDERVHQAVAALERTRADRVTIV